MRTPEQIRADEEWNEILKQVCPRHKIKQSATGDFLDSYCETLQEMIARIRSNPYAKSESLDEECKKALQTDLYDMYSLFVCYNYIMRDYALYDARRRGERYPDGEYPHIPRFNGGFPCSHNFNRYLTGSNGFPFSPLMYEQYYAKVVDVVSEFAESKCQIFPKYLYNLQQDVNGFIMIQKLELFQHGDIPGIPQGNCRLPNYFVVNAIPCTLEDYRLMYEKWFSHTKYLEERWNSFVTDSWPIIKWIQDNRAPEPFKKCHISHRDNSVAARRGLQFAKETADCIAKSWEEESQKWDEKIKMYHNERNRTDKQEDQAYERH